MSELANARIDELPDSPGANPGDYFVIRNMVTGRTERIKVDYFTPGLTSTNFEWLDDVSYNINEVSTYGGTFWQSLVNANLGNTPGVDPTKWVAIPKSPSGLILWQAGVYSDSKVYVLYREQSNLHVYELASATRPYVSANFNTEFAAGDWKLIGDLEVLVVSTVGGVITLDFKHLTQLCFKGSAAIAAPKTWAFANKEAVIFCPFFRFTITNLTDVQTFPADVKVISSVGDFDLVARTWTPPGIGNYEAQLTYDQVNWNLKIFGPLA